jgi:hypothetical protein
MANNIRRHKQDTKDFSEETTKEQALTINANVAWFTKAARNHAQRIGPRAYQKIAAQLEREAAKVRALGHPLEVEFKINAPQQEDRP